MILFSSLQNRMRNNHTIQKFHGRREQPSTPNFLVLEEGNTAKVKIMKLFSKYTDTFYAILRTEQFFSEGHV